MHFFMSCQIDVLNKKLVSSLSWNTPFLKIALSESYILMIDRYLDAKKKHYLDVEGNYKMDIDVKIY